MATKKITELQVAEDVNSDAYVLITQQETDGTKEVVRRTPLFAAVKMFSDGGDVSSVEERVDEIEKILTELTHEDIKITKFTLSKDTAEMGESAQILISVALDREPTDIKLMRGTEILPLSFEVTSGETTISGITANTTFKLIVVDELGHEVTQSKTINFYNGIYTGVGGENTEILSLTRKLQSGKGMTFTVNAGDGEYIYYACPARHGTPVFEVGGFKGGFELLNTSDFTNASGYTEAYQIWRSANARLGNTTVIVS